MASERIAAQLEEAVSSRRRRPTVLLASAATALACVACGGTGRDEPAEASAEPPPLRTDSSAYGLVADTLGWRADLMLTFRNTSVDTLYAVNCNGALTFALERQEPTGWTVVLAPATNACLSPPIVIAPDETFITPWVIYGARPGTNAGPQFTDTTFAGSYRLAWWNLRFHYDPAREQLGDTVPERYRISNEFTLERGP